MTETTGRQAPPFDPELAAVLASFGGAPPTITADMIAAIKQMMPATDPAEVIGDRPIVYANRIIPGPPGAPDLTVSIAERPGRAPGGPAVYYLHGGGMILGDRWFGTGPVIDWVTDLDAVLVTVEYRLAPEHPYPAPLDDCYAGLLWLAGAAAELGYDPGRLVLAGASAGGGLAAGVALRARDDGGPALAGQVLIYPMLDDRNETASSYQIDGFGRWDRGSNETGWGAYLGELRATGAVPAYAAPARAADLSGLPPTFIDAGSAEVFRDEDVAYATRIWAAGGDCELHVWPGGFHAFDMAAPQARLSREMIAARASWLRRTLGY
jgi:acetyl esterase/lipase